MKQFKFLAIAAAMFTVVASLSSCFRDVDPVHPESVDITVEPQKYSVTVTSTAEADFSIDVPATAVPSADKKSVVFTDITTLDSTINITATLINAEGYVTSSQTASVMFESDGNNDKDIAFDFVKLSTETKTQEEVLNATTDVEVNSNPNEYESQMVIPAGTEATGNTTDPYSMTCYAPAPRVINLFPKKNNGSKTRGDGDDDGNYGYDDDDDSHLEDGEGDEIGDVTVDLVNIHCTPYGAQLNNPAILEIKVGTDLAGETLILEYENGEEQESVVQPNGFVQFKVTSFTLKKVKGTIKDLRRSSEAKKAKLTEKTNVKIEAGGTHTISYNKHLGLLQVNPEKENATLTRFLKKCGEEHKMMDESREISSETGCYADILIYQKYYKFTGKLGENKYTFRYWGNTGYNLTTRPLSTGHSGGSGK
jgi:hypothetical protein